MAGEEPLQRLARNSRFRLQRARRQGRRREAHDPIVPAFGEVAHPAQHRGLAGSGVTLDTHHPVLARKNAFDRLLLAFVQPSPMELRFHDPTLHHGFASALTRPHQRDGFGFPRDGRVRGPMPTVIGPRRRMETASRFHTPDSFLRRLDRNGAGVQPERHRQQIGMREHGLTLAQALHRPSDRFQRRGVLAREEVVPDAIPVLPGFHLPGPGAFDDGLDWEPQFRCLARPSVP